MSLLQVAASLQKTAQSLRETEVLLEQAGGLIVNEIKDNIDRGQVAGEFRPVMDTTGAPANGPMSPISKYTLSHRAQAHSDPLKDTGRLYREIGTRNKSAVRIVIGGVTSRARMLLRKHMGSDISGIGSTDLDRPVPYRSPVGYSGRVLAQVLSLFGNAFGINRNVSGSVNYEIRL